MSDSEEDVVLKDDDDVFGEQLDLDDFSFISTEAPSNEKDGNIYDQSDDENDKKQTTSKSQERKSATPDGRKVKQKKRERSPSPNSYSQKQTPPKDRRRIQSESDSDEHEITQNNTRPPPPMVTPESEVHVDMDEIKSFQGKKAGFAEMILQTTPAPAPMYYNASIDPSSFNPAHVTSNPASSNFQERYKDYSSKKPLTEASRPANYAPRPYNPPVTRHPSSQQQAPSMQSGYNQQPLQPLPHVPIQGAPPIPGVALTQQQFDEMYRYKVNTNNNNNHTKPRENKQVREPTLQIANPLAPKVPDEIILEEQKRVELKLEVSKIVVKALTKYFKEGKIANKDDFKHLSRKLTHKIMMKEQGIKHAISEKRTKAIQKFIDNWFRKKGGSYVRKSKPWEKPPSVVNFVPPLHPGM